MSLISSVNSSSHQSLPGIRPDHSKALEEFTLNLWKVFRIRLEVDLQSPLPKKIASILRHFEKGGERPQFVQKIILELKNIAKLEERKTITPADRAHAYSLAGDLLRWMVIESNFFMTLEALEYQTGIPIPLWRNVRSMDEAIEEEYRIEALVITHQKKFCQNKSKIFC